MKVRKAVIAAAGMGTRFLPQTKAMPKEMLPILDKPVIQYVVEELAAAGIEDIVIVTGPNKRSIEDHFDIPNSDLVKMLGSGSPEKKQLLDELAHIATLANFIYIRQKGILGNGTPILNAEHLIGNEPFIYTSGDDFISAQPARFVQLIEAYNEYQCSILGCIRAQKDEDYSRYGFAGGKELSPGMIDIEEVVEKPGKENSPSDLATVSGYVLTPDVFTYLRQARDLKQEGEEFFYNDAFPLMLKDGKRIIAKEILSSKYHDAGNKLEYIKTVVDFALADPKIGPALKDYLSKNLEI